MVVAASLILTILISFLLSTSSSSFAYTDNDNALKSFVQCFLQNTTGSSDLLFTPNSTSYTPLLQSSAQNLRFLASTTNHKPSLIVTPTVESHISVIVTCAYRYDLQLRTRSGGHDYEGMSYVSDDDKHPLFAVVDLALLRNIDIDLRTRTAWVQAGATLGEVYYNVFNRTNGTSGFPAGICPTVGVGGHISTGGFGAMLRKYGATADNVVDARVVGIGGQILDWKSMGEDLFWAIRGGGAASYGVVVAYKLQLVDVPPIVTTFSVYRYSRENATKLLTRWQEIAPELEENLFLRTVAQAESGSETTGDLNIGIQFISLFLGNRNQLLSILEKNFPELGITIEDCNEMTWLESSLFMNGMAGKETEALLNRTPEYNSSFKGKSDFVTQPITESQWKSIWSSLGKFRDMGVTILLIMEPFGGRMSNISESAIPFPHRKGNLYNIQYFMRWFGTDEGESEKQLESMRSFYNFMAPYVSKNPRRSYYSYKDIDLGRTEERWSEYWKAREWGDKYFRGNFERLAIVKQRVDPTNFFRNEQSIPPLYYLRRNEAISSSSFQE